MGRGGFLQFLKEQGSNDALPLRPAKMSEADFKKDCKKSDWIKSYLIVFLWQLFTSQTCKKTASAHLNGLLATWVQTLRIKQYIFFFKKPRTDQIQIRFPNVDFWKCYFYTLATKMAPPRGEI